MGGDVSLWYSASRSPELPGELVAAFACSSWPLSSLTRFSRFRSLSMTLPAPGSGAGACDTAPLLVRRSRRRAHFGGRSVDGKVQAIFARRQLEHGDCLSQRTLRLRQTMQLRDFDTGADDGVLTDELAFFSEFEVEGLAPAFSGGVAADAITADILQSVLSATVLSLANWCPRSLRRSSVVRNLKARLFFAARLSSDSDVPPGVGQSTRQPTRWLRFSPVIRTLYPEESGPESLCARKQRDASANSNHA